MALRVSLRIGKRLFIPPPEILTAGIPYYIGHAIRGVFRCYSNCQTAWLRLDVNGSEACNTTQFSLRKRDDDSCDPDVSRGFLQSTLFTEIDQSYATSVTFNRFSTGDISGVLPANISVGETRWELNTITPSQFGSDQTGIRSNVLHFPSRGVYELYYDIIFPMGGDILEIDYEFFIAGAAPSRRYRTG